MRLFNYFIIIIVNFLLQTTIFENFIIFDTKPNLLLIFVVSFSFLRGDTEGAIIGFFTGLLIDMFFSRFLGLNAFIYMMVGFMTGNISAEFYKDNILICFLLVLVFNFMFGIIYFILTAFFLGYPNLLFFLWDIIIPEALYSSVIAFFIYKPYYIINTYIEKYNRKNKNLFK